MIYHNPTHHRVTIPVGAFKKITQKTNIVSMKDSHRTPLQFIELMNTVKDKISVFVNQTQAYPYVMLGAAGCWSFNVWMGPSPVMRLRDACAAADWESAKQLCLDLDGVGKVGPNIGNLSWRENVFKLSVNEADTAPRDPFAPPGALCRKRLSTTAKKSPPIGRRCAKDIRRNN
jgi:dihydrodipicolinate synthase/N-acetylneuraminate lyase